MAMGMRLGAALAVVLLGSAPALAQPAADNSPLTRSERAAVVARTAETLRNRFYDPSKAAKCVAPMERSQRQGAYEQLTDPAAFAAALTEALRPCGDRHLRIVFEAALGPEAAAEPATPPPAAGTPPAPRPLPGLADAPAYRPRNFDLREARLLEGNVGYLRLYTFAPAWMMGDTLAAAMRFLSNTDGLIIDLRGNRGGYTDSGVLVASYFFERATHYADIYRRVGDHTEQQWTSAWLPGPRLAAQPVYVLTGRDSFSGAESLAYNLQQLGRAKVVGEVTGGGATGGDTLRVGARFTAFVSDVNFTNPASHANWEGVGVRPDIRAGYVEALDVAHAALLEEMAAKATDASRKQELLWARDAVRARAATPPPALPADSAGIVGAYGTRVIWNEGGRLFYRNGENALFLMRRMGPDLYVLEGEPTVQFSFERGADGRATRLTAHYLDGSTVPTVRSGG